MLATFHNAIATRNQKSDLRGMFTVFFFAKLVAIRGKKDSTRNNSARS